MAMVNGFDGAGPDVIVVAQDVTLPRQPPARDCAACVIQPGRRGARDPNPQTRLMEEKQWKKRSSCSPRRPLWPS